MENQFSEVIKKCYYGWSSNCVKYGPESKFQKQSRMCLECRIEKNKRFYKENKIKLNLKKRALERYEHNKYQREALRMKMIIDLYRRVKPVTIQIFRLV